MIPNLPFFSLHLPSCFSLPAFPALQGAYSFSFSPLLSPSAFYFWVLLSSFLHLHTIFCLLGSFYHYSDRVFHKLSSSLESPPIVPGETDRLLWHILICCAALTVFHCREALGPTSIKQLRQMTNNPRCLPLKMSLSTDTGLLKKKKKNCAFVKDVRGRLQIDLYITYQIKFRGPFD